MQKAFASQGDLQEKKITFTRLSQSGWAYEAESDPTSGVIVGETGCMVIDARATPILAQDVIAKVRTVTEKPIKWVVLTHYHAVRVLGASAYGAEHIVCSDKTLELIRERGQADYDSEVGRFPRLFQNVETVPGLTWPTITFSDRMTIMLGRTRVELMHLGRGHTQGDIVVTLPDEGVVFSGDLVENGAAVYMGDAHPVDWLQTLERVRALKAQKLVPGRGPALESAEAADAAIVKTAEFIRTCYETVQAAKARGASLGEAYKAARQQMDPKYGGWPIYEHCIPFDVARCYDVAGGRDHPMIWTAERDRQLWTELQG